MKRKVTQGQWPVDQFGRRLAHLARERARALKFRLDPMRLPGYDQIEWIMGQGDGEKVAQALAACLWYAYDGQRGDVPAHIDVTRKFVEENRVLIAEVALTFTPKPMPDGLRRRLQ